MDALRCIGFQCSDNVLSWDNAKYMGVAYDGPQEGDLKDVCKDHGLELVAKVKDKSMSYAIFERPAGDTTAIVDDLEQCQMTLISGGQLVLEGEIEAHVSVPQGGLGKQTLEGNTMLVGPVVAATNPTVTEDINSGSAERADASFREIRDAASYQKELHDKGYTSFGLSLYAENGSKKAKFDSRWSKVTYSNCLKAGRYEASRHNALAIVTGKPSNVIVLDIDVGEDNFGLKAWDEFVESFGKNDAYEVRSASGGLHRFYSLSKSKELGLKATSNSARQIFDESKNRLPWDIRGDGGMIFTAPSCYTTEDGRLRVYQSVGEIPVVEDLPPMEEELIARIHRGKKLASVRLNQAPATKSAKEGARVEEVKRPERITFKEEEEKEEDDEEEEVEVPLTPELRYVLQKIKEAVVSHGDKISFTDGVPKIDLFGNPFFVFRHPRGARRPCFYSMTANHISNNFKVTYRGTKLLLHEFSSGCCDKHDLEIGDIPYGMCVQSTGVCHEVSRPGQTTHPDFPPISSVDFSVLDNVHPRRALKHLRDDEMGLANLIAEMYRPTGRLLCKKVGDSFVPYLWRGDRGFVPDPAMKLLASATRPLLLALQKRHFDDLYPSWVADLPKKVKALIKPPPKVRTTSTMNAVMAQVPPLIMDDCLEFDTCYDHLPVKNGVVCMKTYRLLQHHPGFRYTNVARGVYDTSAARHAWRLIRDLMQSDEEASYLQKLMGYGITGHTSEQKLVIMTGAGANGKSLMFIALKKALGSYYTEMSRDAILTAAGQQGGSKGGASPHLHQLKGARIACADESGSSDTLSEADVKSATSGGDINSRPLYGQPEPFTATHLPIILTNNPPRFNSEDFAMRRRLVVIPFFNRYLAEEDVKDLDPQRLDPTIRVRDDGLVDRVATEEYQTSFLMWALEGAKRWYDEGGLGPMPKTFMAATQEYFAENDTLQVFLDDHCKFGQDERVKACALYNLYKAKHRTVTKIQFGRMMKRKGYESKSIRLNGETVWGYEGISLSWEG